MVSDPVERSFQTLRLNSSPIWIASTSSSIRRGARKPVAGTLPIGYQFPHGGNEGQLTSSLDFGRGDDYASSGLFGDFYGSGYPEGLEFDEAFLARGKER